MAQFIGSPVMNVFAGTLRGDSVDALGVRWPVLPGLGREGRAVQYGTRPTDLIGSPQGVPAQVVVMHGRTLAQPDDIIYLSLDPAMAHVFDAGSGARLG